MGGTAGYGLQAVGQFSGLGLFQESGDVDLQSLCEGFGLMFGSFNVVEFVV